MSRQAGQMAGQLASELRRADQWIDNESVHRTLEKLWQGGYSGGILSSLQKNTNQIAERWRNMYNKPLSAGKYLGQDLGRCTHPGKVLH